MKPRFLILLACLSVLIGVPFMNAADKASEMPVYGTFKAPLTSSAASPAFQFNGDTGVGIRRSGTDELSMCTAGSDRLTIDLNGKVGIGTTVPTTALDVVGAIQGSTTITAKAASSQLVLGATPTTQATISTSTSGAGKTYSIPADTATSNFVMSEGNATINGTKTFGSAISADISKAGTVAITSTGAGVTVGLHSSAGDDFNVNSGKLVVEGDTGYVGVGTSAPSSLLNVVGSTSANTGIIVSGNVAGGMSASFRYPGSGAGGVETSGYADGTKPASLYNVSDTRADVRKYDGTNTGILTLLSNGKVGIGSGTPSTNLNVVGDNTDGNTYGVVRIDNNARNNSGISLTTSFASKSADARYWQIQTNYSSNGSLEFLKGTTNSDVPTTPVAIFDRSGQLGIGTTIPSDKLEVVGGGVIAPYHIGLTASDSTLAGGASQLQAKNTNTAVGQMSQIIFGRASSYAPASIGAIVSTTGTYGSSDIFFATRTATNDTQPTERMRISASGMVGIGSAAPSVALDVVGAVKATTTITATTGIDANGGGVIKWKKITGTTNASNGSFSAAHGISGVSNIAGWTSSVLYNGTTMYTPGTAIGYGVEGVVVDGTNVTLGSSSNSNSWDKTFNVIIFYF